MKKGIITIILAISFLQVNFAQKSEDWQQQMEDLQQKMQEMAQQLSKQFGGSHFNFDTAFLN